MASVGRHRALPPVTVLLSLLGLVLPFVLWEVNAQAQQNLLVPKLGEIVQALQESAESGALWYNASVTLRSALCGLLLAVVVGVALGTAMAQSRLLEAVLSPLLGASYPVPKLALYPVAILIFGLGTLPVVILVALECMYPIAYNTFQGVRSTPRELVRAAANSEGGPLRTFGAVHVPSALPSVMTGLRIAVPIMIVVAVVVEMLGQSRGLGFLIRDAGRAIEPALALGVILLLGVVGVALDFLIKMATRRLVFWEVAPGE